VLSTEGNLFLGDLTGTRDWDNMKPYKEWVDGLKTSKPTYKKFNEAVDHIISKKGKERNT